MRWCAYPSCDIYGPIKACKVLTVLSGSRPHRSGTSQRYAHPTTDLARAVSCPEGKGSSVSARRTQTNRPGSESAPAFGPLTGSAVPVTPSHEPVVAADHMSDGRTRTRRTCPGINLDVHYGPGSRTSRTAGARAAVRLARCRRLKAAGEAVADRRVATRTARMLRVLSELPRRRPALCGKWST